MGMKSSNLTKRQLAVLRFIQQFLQEKGCSPTLKEIASGVGSNAVSTIHKHVQHLIDKGFLDRSHGSGNNIIIKEHRDIPGAPKGKPVGLGRTLPYCGDVAAGAPITPETKTIPIEVPGAIHRDKDDLFVLRVRGDSMCDDSILDGDLVVLQKRAEYHNGDRVVALIDGEEATLKELRKAPDGVWLIPHNPEMQPNFYEPERIEVQGLLVGVMRSC